MKFCTPSLLLDLNYTHSFNNPIDNTVVGSTALARNNEVQLSALHFGGDFYFENARARVMMQFGTRSIVVPRNDYSPYRGQYQLANVYRYLSEAYVGYHIHKLYGINIDAGMFMSYIGLNSYYQPENWEYQASFTSDNTPWFFNGLRIQIYPTKNLKIEPWIINGWQSYGKFNRMPGFGANLTYMPSSNFKILTNDYYGSDAAGLPGRKRFHSDNSMLVRYRNKPESNGISRMAFSLTADFGFEKGGGVMTNPGRYLVLLPTGQASPLPNPGNPAQTEGAFPFGANPVFPILPVPVASHHRPAIQPLPSNLPGDPIWLNQKAG